MNHSEIENKLKERVKLGKELEGGLSAMRYEQDFNEVERKYFVWDEYNYEYLRKYFKTSEISEKYKEPALYLGYGTHIHPDSVQGRSNKVKFFLPKKIQQLESIINRIELLEVNNQELKESNQQNMKKVFISHASKDKVYVREVIDLIEAMGVPSRDIFCTSFEGYGIKLGEDFLQRIKNELNDEVLVVFILSENFYNSAVCLCEMGATWVKTNKHIPVLIPPFSYDKIRGVIPHTQGLIINEKLKWNSFKETVESFMNSSVNHSVWEEKRDKILAKINELVSSDSITEVEKKK